MWGGGGRISPRQNDRGGRGKQSLKGKRGNGGKRIPMGMGRLIPLLVKCIGGNRGCPKGDRIVYKKMGPQ